MQSWQQSSLNLARLETKRHEKLSGARSILLLLLLCTCVPGGEVQTADWHRKKFPGKEAYHTYVSTAAVPVEDREGLIKALAFMTATSSRQYIVEYCVPERISPTLWHLDLERLKWNVRDWIKVLESYPYYHGQSYPLVVRADWLLVQLADSDASDAHYRLLYGSQNVPKTIQDFRAFWGVDSSPELKFGLIEGKSGVSVQSFRWLENRPVSRGYYWETKDVLKIQPGADPLEAPDGNFKADGSEYILGTHKVSIKKGTRGVLQVYLLTNGQGKVVNQAPTDLVEDHSRFRNLAAIRTSGSCIGCHITGILEPTTNELRSLIKLGVDIYAKDKKKQEAVELFHLGDVDSEIKHNQELYARGVKAVNHLTPQENAAGFKKAVEDYDKDLSLEDMAREHYCKPEELKFALAYYGALPARLAALAHSKPIPRHTAEAHWYLVRQALLKWNDSR